jgi:hypothetical protein
MSHNKTKLGLSEGVNNATNEIKEI